MFKITDKKLIIIIGLLLLLVGVLARLLTYSPFLTYVDSYKYLLQAQSFTSKPALDYVVQNSGPFAKWGFSLILVAVNAFAGFKPEQFVVLAKIVNMGLSLILAVLALKISRKNWLLAVPFFISPLFFSYSSYVISEYLTLLLIAWGITLLAAIEADKKQRMLLISLGVIMGFLPLVRIEMAVVSIVIAMYVYFTYRKQGLWMLIPGLAMFLLTGSFLSLQTGSSESFTVSILKVFANNWIFALLFMVVMTSYYLWGHKYRTLLVKIVSAGILLYLSLFAMASFTLNNAFVIDPVLYVFMICCWCYVLYLLFWKRVVVTQLFAELVLIIAALIATYTIFNKDIDRYAITLIGLMLIAVMVCLQEYAIEWSVTKVVFPVLCLFAIVAVRNVIVETPEPSDYQQYVVTNLPDEVDHGRFFVSGFVYLADIYFRQATPLLADKAQLADIQSGDYVLYGDSLKIVNPSLYQDIADDFSEFNVVKSIPNQRAFNYSAGVIVGINDVQVLKKL